MKETLQVFKKEGITPVWCPGCGDYGVYSALQKAFAQLGLKPEEIVIVSGIGCSGRFSHYFNTYSLHGTHGRAVPTATGVKAVRPELTVLAVGGDGDGLSIGGGHIAHAARRNTDITYLILDNNIYGLTKGQTSPTTREGHKSSTSPYGVAEDILEPIPVFLTYDVSFVARQTSFDLKGLTETLVKAIEHRGMSIVHILSPCVTYKALPWDEIKGSTKPLPEDYTARDKLEALKFGYSKEPVYTGIFYQIDKPTLDDRLKQIEESANKGRGGNALKLTAREIMEDFR